MQSMNVSTVLSFDTLLLRLIEPNTNFFPWFDFLVFVEIVFKNFVRYPDILVPLLKKKKYQ